MVDCDCYVLKPIRNRYQPQSRHGYYYISFCLTSSLFYKGYFFVVVIRCENIKTLLVTNRDLQRALRPDQTCKPPRHMYLTSRYSSMPHFEPSRPKPDCLTPPKAPSAAERRASFTPTIPTSNASATRQI